MTTRARVGGRRLFMTYAAASLLPVVLLGVALSFQAAAQADSRGLSRARGEAALVAQGQLAPLLGDSPLSSRLPSAERSALTRGVAAAVKDRQVLRLRLRDLHAHVVFSSDGTTTNEDDEALAAAGGKVVSRLSRLDADSGAQGPRVAEVYQPILSSASGRPLGVVEMYLPYAPIAADIAAQRLTQIVTLTLGLLLLWLTLLAITASTTRRLRRSADESAYLATHDVLTGLPNRASFVDLADRAVAAGPCAVAILDLDRFQAVNDALGHGIGDRLLVVLASRLAAFAKEGCVVARLGGDEFGIVVPARDEPSAELWLTRVRSTFLEPVVLDGLPIGAESSIGYALANDDGTDAAALLTHAEVAMYAAKRGHLGPTRHRRELDRYDETRLRLLGELDSAIREGQLVLHYQPKSSLLTGRVVAVEALVRWQHPQRGLLYPDAFLVATEQTGLIDGLTAWVVGEAARGIQRLDPSGSLSIAVNVSARNVVRPDFAGSVLDALATARLTPTRLIVEMTETALLTDPEAAFETLRSLSNAGVRISIDDFGAGQTSLGYLARLPIDELKIDRAFVQHLDTDQRSAAIVRAVIELAHGLGFTVTAEGVETAAVMQLLAFADCDLVQGYYVARPAAEHVIAALVIAQGAPISS